MTGVQPQQTTTKHQYSEPCGHLRAQHSAMDYYNSEAYEREKAAITSYEDGWDSWDGPVWPWRHTNITTVEQEEHYEGCCCEPANGVTTAKSTEKLQTGRHTPVRMASSSSVATTSSTSSETSSKAASPASTPLWSSRTASPCPTCGRGGAKNHHL